MDIEERIFDKLDKIQLDVTDLCLRLSALEQDYKSHLQELQEEQNKKLRRRDYLLVIVGLGLGGIEILRSLGVV